MTRTRRRDGMATKARHLPVDLAFAAGGIALLILVALPVGPDKSPAVERSAFHIINNAPGFLYWPAWVVMQLGNLVAIPAAALVTAAFRRFRLALAILLAGLAKIETLKIVKAQVERGRPASFLANVHRRGDVSIGGQAFVSGHAVIVVALATLLHPYLDRRGRILVWSIAAVVCLARVYVGAHLPLDVIGGGALGFAIGSLLNFAIGRPNRS